MVVACLSSITGRWDNPSMRITLGSRHRHFLYRLLDRAAVSEEVKDRASRPGEAGDSDTSVDYVSVLD